MGLARVRAAATGRVLAGGDAPKGLLGDAPCLFEGHPSVAPDDEAAVGGLSTAAAGAIVDDVGADVGGLDTNAEPGQLVIPGDEGLIGELQRLGGAFVQGQLEVGGSLAGLC